MNLNKKITLLTSLCKLLHKIRLSTEDIYVATKPDGSIAFDMIPYPNLQVYVNGSLIKPTPYEDAVTVTISNNKSWRTK